MKKTTLKDVAAKAGVSVTTVSLVLSGKGRISDSVRKAVLDATEATGYAPRRFADTPGRFPTIGILVHIDAQWAFVWWFIRPIIEEIESYFTERNYNVIMIPISISMSEDAIARKLTEERCSAVFSLHYGNESLFSSLEDQKIPVVLIMNGQYQDRFHSILVDDFQGAYEGTTHLIKLGHRDILYIDTPRIDLPVLMTDRFYGFKKALDENSIPFSEERHINCDISDTRYLEARLRSILQSPDPPTAVFAIDDDVAIRVIALARKMQIRVPEELSVIAPGELLNYEDPFIFPITTLRINTKLMGRLASDMMMEQISRRSKDIQVLKVKQQLVQRGSIRPKSHRDFNARMPHQMSPRDRILSAFTRDGDGKVPKWLGASPEFIHKACSSLGVDEDEFRSRIGDDIRWIQVEGSDSIGSRRSGVYGIMLRKSGDTIPAEHPLGKDPSIKNLHDFPWPDQEEVDVSGIRNQIKDFSDEYAIGGGDWSPFWHDAVDLLGMETLACLMYDDPVFIETLLSRITDYYIAVSTRIFEEAGDLIDLFLLRNDFGTQTGPILGLEHFTQFIVPCLKRFANLGHRYGIKVILHSSGGIRPLIPAIIESGIDALHALQPDCPGMQPASLKRDFGQRIVLSGGIDARGILRTGTPDTVRTRTRETLDAMTPGGGYIAAPSVDIILDDTPVENVMALFETISGYTARS